LETVVDILVGQIEARLNENESKPNDSGVNLNFEKSMANGATRILLFRIELNIF
jgi:hypothetical protein